LYRKQGSTGLQVKRLDPIPKYSDIVSSFLLDQ